MEHCWRRPRVTLGLGALRFAAADASPCASLQGFWALECVYREQKAREAAHPGLTPHFPPRPGDPAPARPLTPLEQACAGFVDLEEWSRCAAPILKGLGTASAAR